MSEIAVEIWSLCKMRISESELWVSWKRRN